MAHISLSLAVHEVKGSFAVPVWLSLKDPFEHLDFDVNVNLPLEELVKSILYRRMEFLAMHDINLVSLPLSAVGPELSVVAR